MSSPFPNMNPFDNIFPERSENELGVTGVGLLVWATTTVACLSRREYNT